jgi:hypothetical protein
MALERWSVRKQATGAKFKSGAGKPKSLRLRVKYSTQSRGCQGAVSSVAEGNPSGCPSSTTMPVQRSAIKYPAKARSPLDESL